MSQTLPGYRLKIERAKRHIREMAEEIEAFHARKPYTIVVEEDANRGQRIWKVRINESIPAHWSAIVGDAIHNARAALDLMMVAIVRHCDPHRASYNHVYFIVGESKEKFEARLSENIKGASDEARQIIEGLKPYKGGDEAFWRLHRLDVLDKHKAIIPVGAAHTRVVMQFDAQRLFPKFVKEPTILPLPLIPKNRQFPLKDGAVLFTADLGDHVMLPRENDVQFTFEVAFGERQILDGEPVIPALTQMCEFVEGVFDIIERNILSK